MLDQYGGTERDTEEMHLKTKHIMLASLLVLGVFPLGRAAQA